MSGEINPTRVTTVLPEWNLFGKESLLFDWDVNYFVRPTFRTKCNLES